MEKQGEREKQPQIFHYVYSADQQDEIKRIREKYCPGDRKEDKMEQLRNLDRSVTSRGTQVSIIMGILGILIFGGGLSWVMVWGNLFSGSVIGITGLCLMGAAYPVFRYMTEKQKEKVAPEILRLTEELMK